MGTKLAHSRCVLYAYRFLARAAHRLPYPAGVLRASLAARRCAAARWVAWAHAMPERGPVLWIHGASVGELQTAEPVVARVRRARPTVRVVQTHTSPSVCRTAAPPGVDHADFLPLDEPSHVAQVLDTVRPAVLAFSRGDLWPELVHQASQRRIPIAVIGATVRSHSRRLARVARLLLGATHRAVGWVGAVTEHDATRWVRLGVWANRVVVTGDPRHDRILERLPSLAVARLVMEWAGDEPVLVAGSLERGDDLVVGEALGRLAGDRQLPRTVVVPHDSTPARVSAVRAALDRRGVRPKTWDGPPHPLPDARVVVAPTFGLLADLYFAGSVAYVGGGFRRGTLHAVAEPAAMGLPILVGCRWQGAADVDRLLAAGGGIALPDRNAPAALAHVAARLCANEDERRRRGLAARGILSQGAATRSADVLLQLLAGSPPAPLAPTTG